MRDFVFIVFGFIVGLGTFINGIMKLLAAKKEERKNQFSMSSMESDFSVNAGSGILLTGAGFFILIFIGYITLDFMGLDLFNKTLSLNKYSGQKAFIAYT